MQVKVDLGDPYGVIEVMINTPSTYPFEPPTMTIRSKIVHPNVYRESGLVCMR